MNDTRTHLTLREELTRENNLSVLLEAHQKALINLISKLNALAKKVMLYYSYFNASFLQKVNLPRDYSPIFSKEFLRYQI